MTTVVSQTGENVSTLVCLFLLTAFDWSNRHPIGNSHLGRMLESLKEYRVLIDEFMALDASLRIERPTEVAEWLTDIVKWENTLPLSTPTPYDLPEHGMCSLHLFYLFTSRTSDSQVSH